MENMKKLGRMELQNQETIPLEEAKDYAFQALSAVRESISIAKRQPTQVPYESALDIVHEVNPEAYTYISDLLTKRNKSDEVRFFMEKAEALSTDEKQVTPVELIDIELGEIEVALNKGKVKGTSLTKRKIALLAAIDYFKPRVVSEHKILSKDFYLVGRKLPDALEIYKDEKFVDYKLGDDRFLRLRLLHPDNEEEILGADLIYEQYDLAKERARFVHVQYKMWTKQGIYFSQGNIVAQVEKIRGHLCDSGYCHSPLGANVGDGYRMPFCSGFLRPTDKQQDNGKDMTSSGLHLPICYIKRLIAQPAPKISRQDAKASGLSHNVFDEMFVNGFVGSRWLELNELEDFYASKGIESHMNTIRVHAQEIYIEAENKKVG